MNIDIEMTDVAPKNHGIYYMVKKREDRALLQGRVYQGHADYFPMVTFNGEDIPLEKAMEKYYFSVEPVTFSAFKKSGQWTHQLL